MKFEVVSEIRAELGEGPVWHPVESVLYVIDIVNGRVNRFDPNRNSWLSCQFPSMVGCVVPFESGGVIAATEKGFFIVRHDSSMQALTVELLEATDLPPVLRFNDGKCSPAGRIWVGTMHKEFAPNSGNLFAKTTTDDTQMLLASTSLSNGLDWSPDESTFYHIDTPTNRVAIYPYRKTDDQIELNPEYMPFLDGAGYPDGMCVDSEGMIWIAHFAGSAISRWNPATKQLVAQYALPVTHVSSICFGGDDLDEIYVTTASEGFSDEQLIEQPLAGQVFRAKAPVAGKPAYCFRRSH